MSPFLKCLVCTVIQNVHFLNVGLSYLHKNQEVLCQCPITLISGEVQFPNVRLSQFHKKSNFQMSYCLISSKCHFSECPTAIVAWKVLLFRIFDFTFGQNVHFQMSVIFQMSYYHSGKKSSSFSKTPTFTDGRNVLFKCPKLYEMTLFMCPQLHEMSIIFQMSYCISSTEKFFFSISFFRSIDGRKCALDQTLLKSLLRLLLFYRSVDSLLKQVPTLQQQKRNQ